jgi:thiamine transport system permease protein
VLGFSLWQALLSTLLSLGLAIPVASALARRRFTGRRLLLKLFGLSLVLPVIIAIFGMVAVHGRQGWLPQLLHGLGWIPATTSMACSASCWPMSSSTCRWPPASFCRA